MTQDRHARGIGYYLTALILLAVVPLLIITGVLVWRQSAVQRQAFERSMLQTALALSVAVDRQLESYRVMLETLSESDSLRRGDIDTFYGFAKRAADHNGALFISLFDRDGHQVFNTMRAASESLPTPFKDPRVTLGETDRPPVGDPRYLKRAFQTGQANYSDLTYGLVAGKLIFLVNVPVLHEGKVAYVVNAAFDPAVMTRLLQENPVFRGVPAVIFDRDGFIVGRWLAEEDYVGKRVLSYEKMKGRDFGADEGTTYEGLKVYYAFARSSVSGWGVNVGPERGDIETQIHAGWTVGIALAVLGLAVDVMLALALAARLRRSIAALADSAARDAPARLEGLRTREIVQLGRALDASARAREAEARERESRVVAEAREAEAEEASRMKDRFIALLSHELRNPLAPIRNAVYLLRTLNQPVNPELDAIVGMLDRQSEHLTRLVNDLLDVSRVNVGKMSLHQERLDLRSVADHALETALPAITQRRHRFTKSLPDRPVEVIGDAVRVAQVILNLLDNAAKFTPEAGEIRLSLGVENGQAVVRVRDNGPGIEASMLAEVFQPFVQSQKLTEHSGPAGLGLGLTLAKSLAELHGGTVEAASEGPGKGSEFILRLPLASGN